MPKIIWSDALSVGDPEIDRQHRQWVDIFNTAHDRMLSDDSTGLSTIGMDALNKMIDYADTHFEYEEAYMKEIGYPNRSKHIQIHALFKNKLQRIKEDYENGTKLLNSEIIKIVKNWLLNHIQEEDKKFVSFAKSK